MMETPAAVWFEERVRSLLRYPSADDAEWVAFPDVASDEALAGIEARQRAGAGATPRVALTTAAGWMSGYVAAALAIGLLRDGVLPRLSLATGLQARREAGGWLSDVRFDDVPLLVPPGHPLAESALAMVVPDPAAAFGEEVLSACGPWIDAIAGRSGRSRSGLWAMAADAVGSVAKTIAAAEADAESIEVATAVVAGGETERGDRSAHHPVHAAGDRAPLAALLSAPCPRTLDEWAEATNALLERPGAPWKRGPQLRVVADPAGPVLVQHRVSCCLWYRCEPELADDPAAVRAAIPETPNYCATCVFREPDDVERRARAEAAAQAALAS